VLFPDGGAIGGDGRAIGGDGGAAPHRTHP